MNKKYTFLLTLLFILISQFGTSQNNYKIIDAELKEKIEYDNSKKADRGTLNSINYVQVYYLYDVAISSYVEEKEKIKDIMDEFKKSSNLESTSFDFNNNIWHICAKHGISNESIKSILDKYDHKASSISEKYGLKD